MFDVTCIYFGDHSRRGRKCIQRQRSSSMITLFNKKNATYVALMVVVKFLAWIALIHRHFRRKSNRKSHGQQHLFGNLYFRAFFRVAVALIIYFLRRRKSIERQPEVNKCLFANTKKVTISRT